MYAYDRMRVIIDDYVRCWRHNTIKSRPRGMIMMTIQTQKGYVILPKFNKNFPDR